MSARCWRRGHGWGWHKGPDRRVDTALRRADRRARRNGRPRNRFDTPRQPHPEVPPAWSLPDADPLEDMRRAYELACAELAAADAPDVEELLSHDRGAGPLLVVYE